MVELEDKLSMFSNLERERTFKKYLSLLPPEIDLIGEIISRLQTQNHVNFYDIGCGNGKAGEGKDGIFDTISCRLIASGEDPSLVNKIRYVGIDLLPHGNSETYRQRLITYDVENVHQIMDELPKIDVGLSLWGFPYFEKKMETLEVLTKHLNKDGVIIIYPFHEDLTLVYAGGGLPLTASFPVYRECFDTDLKSNALMVRGNSAPVADKVRFRKSEVYHTCTNVKNCRFGQMSSIYDIVSPQPSTRAA